MSLIAWYKCDETGGTILHDNKSANYHGTLLSGAAFTSDGKLGGAIEFDGIDDYAFVNHTMSSFTNGLSISAWVYNNSSLGNPTYQAENYLGDIGVTTSTGGTTYVKGTYGVDPSGGCMVNFLLTNSDLGSKYYFLYGFQSSAGAVAGRADLIDDVSGTTLSSRNLNQITSLGAITEQCLNVPGNNLRLKVYFNNTRDLYIDRVTLANGRNGIVVSPLSTRIMFCKSDDNLRFRVGASNSSQGPNQAIPPGWSHVVGSWDKQKIVTYVNGISSSSVNQTNSLPAITGGWYLGNNLDFGNARWWGKIDDIRIYDHGLTQDEVLGLYNEGHGTYQENRESKKLDYARKQKNIKRVQS